MIDVGDWKRDGDCHNQWNRRGADGNDVYVNDNAERGVFRALVCGTLLGSTFACPDAAREAADAYLVSQGRLDKSRAFVRLGEWEPAAPKGHWARVGDGGGLVAMGHEREGADAAAVKLGLLDPSRAFKATTENTPNTMTRIPPEKHNSEPPEVARAAKPAWSHNGSTQTTVMPLGGSTYTIPAGYSPEHVASKINADPNAPVTATVKHGAISLEQRVIGTAKPAWGEWEKFGTFYRRPSKNGHTPIGAHADKWVRGGDKQALATDIDDAREKADAFLVARGELEAARAFKRVGDWEVDVIDYMRQYRPSERYCVKAVANGWFTFSVSGDTTFDAKGPETGVAGKAAADAELVRRGLLAEERAFKVAKPSAVSVQRIFLPGSTESFTVEGAEARPFCVQRTPDGQTRVTDWNGAGCAVGPGDVLTYTVTDGVGRFAVKARVSVDRWAVGIDYASAHGDTSTTVVVNRRADGVSEVAGYAHNIANMSDDEINAMYGKNSEVARALIGAKRRETRTVVHTVTNPATTTVTLATWEHHLPALLDNAPREFRDGFNRRRGPAWEAYLVALAGVKEQIQCKRFVGPSALADVVRVAAGRARYAMGVEWALANTKRETE